MTQSDGWGGPRAGEWTGRDHGADDPYAMWDAAYVLGSLTSGERREYEAHLSSCGQCREAVSALSGMPALLALLDRDEVAGIDDDLPEPPPMRPEILETLLAKVRWRRKRSRFLTWGVVAAAAAVLAVGLVVALRPNSVMTSPEPPRATASAMTMTPVASNSLDASVSVSSHGWGTRVEMTCFYHDSKNHDDGAGDKLAMVVVGRDGSHTQLATWMALTGVTALPGGSTSMPIDEIVAVQVVSSDTGDVLLQRNL
jgi:hypothetical protein